MMPKPHWLMRIELQNIGKRYRLDRIFSKVSYTFSAPNRYAILGPNGSGKSTLLQIIAGHLAPTSGKIIYTDAQNNAILPELVYKQVSIASPYLELIEEFTLPEMLRFHRKLKPLLYNMPDEEFADLLHFANVRHKQLRFFSSGMKQRVKLGLALLSDTPVVLLDEPTSNLDADSFNRYLYLVERFAVGRLLIIASNQPAEYAFCNDSILISDYK